MSRITHLGALIASLLARFQIRLADPLVHQLCLFEGDACAEEQLLCPICLDGIQISPPLQISCLSLGVGATGRQESLEVLAARG